MNTKPSNTRWAIPLTLLILMLLALFGFGIDLDGAGAGFWLLVAIPTLHTGYRVEGAAFPLVALS